MQRADPDGRGEPGLTLVGLDGSELAIVGEIGEHAQLEVVEPARRLAQGQKRRVVGQAASGSEVVGGGDADSIEVSEQLVLLVQQTRRPLRPRPVRCGPADVVGLVAPLRGGRAGREALQEIGAARVIGTLGRLARYEGDGVPESRKRLAVGAIALEIVQVTLARQQQTAQHRARRVGGHGIEVELLLEIGIGLDADPRQIGGVEGDEVDDSAALPHPHAQRRRGAGDRECGHVPQEPVPARQRVLDSVLVALLCGDTPQLPSQGFRREDRSCAGASRRIHELDLDAADRRSRRSGRGVLGSWAAAAQTREDQNDRDRPALHRGVCSREARLCQVPAGGGLRSLLQKRRGPMARRFSS